MGNRFSTDARYRNLIIAHGVIAALVFLLVMPLAVFVAKFYHTNGRHALRLHIALQMVALVFLTAVIVIAIFAVGTARSLTNPHHGIGIAIYALVVLQTVAGILMRWSERKKPRPYRLPLKLMVRVVESFRLQNLTMHRSTNGLVELLFCSALPKSLLV